jgi:hypothetical protein
MTFFNIKPLPETHVNIKPLPETHISDIWQESLLSIPHAQNMTGLDDM